MYQYKRHKVGDEKRINVKQAGILIAVYVSFNNSQKYFISLINTLNYFIEIFTNCKLCLADAIHNFK